MLKYVKGDLFREIEKINNPILIAHISNDIRAWGSGFVIPLGDRFPKARERYLKEPKLTLGDTQFIETCGVVVANMIAQRGIIQKGLKPIKYAALVKCLNTVGFFCRTRHVDEIHAPAFGSLRSGGHWPFIHELIEEIWCDINVTIYYLDDNQKSQLETPLKFKI